MCLQRYLDMSSDIQTACLISMYWLVFETDLKSKKEEDYSTLKGIIDEYHEFLNIHKKWSERSALDVAFSNLR